MVLAETQFFSVSYFEKNKEIVLLLLHRTENCIMYFVPITELSPHFWKVRGPGGLFSASGLTIVLVEVFGEPKLLTPALGKTLF